MCQGVVCPTTAPPTPPPTQPPSPTPVVTPPPTPPPTIGNVVPCCVNFQCFQLDITDCLLVDGDIVGNVGDVCAPNICPTLAPTSSPTRSPTLSPTRSPTASPSLSPSETPTRSPSGAPTASPTISDLCTLQEPNNVTGECGTASCPDSNPQQPSQCLCGCRSVFAPFNIVELCTLPTASPTVSPSASPSLSPTAAPTVSPTTSPSPAPTLPPDACTEGVDGCPGFTGDPFAFCNRNLTNMCETVYGAVTTEIGCAEGASTDGGCVCCERREGRCPFDFCRTRNGPDSFCAPLGACDQKPATQQAPLGFRGIEDDCSALGQGTPLTCQCCIPVTPAPTTSPTASPTNAPSVSPTISPSVSPSVSPTNAPSSSPTQSPSNAPSSSPTLSPSVSPTTSPSVSPSSSPTRSPSASPTKSPTTSPTTSPSVSPSTSPTLSPSASPSVTPTNAPSTSPTVSPTNAPSSSPTLAPTASPTFIDCTFNEFNATTGECGMARCEAQGIPDERCQCVCNTPDGIPIGLCGSQFIDCQGGEDDCALFASLPAITTDVPEPYCTLTATPNDVGSVVCTSNEDLTNVNDVWFRYPATCTGYGIFTLTMFIGTQVRLTVYNTTTCPPESGSCLTARQDFTPDTSNWFYVESGSEYLVRISGVAPGFEVGSAGEVTITCFDTNNDCGTCTPPVGWPAPEYDDFTDEPCAQSTATDTSFQMNGNDGCATPGATVEDSFIEFACDGLEHVACGTTPTSTVSDTGNFGNDFDFFLLNATAATTDIRITAERFANGAMTFDVLELTTVPPAGCTTVDLNGFIFMGAQQCANALTPGGNPQAFPPGVYLLGVSAGGQFTNAPFIGQGCQNGASNYIVNIRCELDPPPLMPITSDATNLDDDRVRLAAHGVRIVDDKGGSGSGANTAATLPVSLRNKVGGPTYKEVYELPAALSSHFESVGGKELPLTIVVNPSPCGAFGGSAVPGCDCPSMDTCATRTPQNDIGCGIARCPDASEQSEQSNCQCACVNQQDSNDVIACEQTPLPRANDICILAIGPNSFNADETGGFFRVFNTFSDPTRSIVRMEWDWTTSSNPAQSSMVFDTDQDGMADVCNGGNSAVVGCQGTYRLGTEVSTGLLFQPGQDAPVCDGSALSGFDGSNPAFGVSYATLEFEFAPFQFFNGLTFQVDIDTDGGAGISGDSMAGMVVNVELQDGTMLSGELGNANGLAIDTSSLCFFGVPQLIPAVAQVPVSVCPSGYDGVCSCPQSCDSLVVNNVTGECGMALCPEAPFPLTCACHCTNTTSGEELSRCAAPPADLCDPLLVDVEPRCACPDTLVTRNPTVSPTNAPSTSPTVSPTNAPSESPTVSPSQSPSVSPTNAPSGSPTNSPSRSPTSSPSVSPSQSPTVSPSQSPSVSPTTSPTASPTPPTPAPTLSPSVSPTTSPSQSPSVSPTNSPSVSPTVSPTRSPSTSPTNAPTASPTPKLCPLVVYYPADEGQVTGEPTIATASEQSVVHDRAADANKNTLYAEGDAYVNSINPKLGASSMYMDGSPEAWYQSDMEGLPQGASPTLSVALWFLFSQHPQASGNVNGQFMRFGDNPHLRLFIDRTGADGAEMYNFVWDRTSDFQRLVESGPMPAFALNTWHHLAVGYDGASTAMMWLDGALVDTNVGVTAFTVDYINGVTAPSGYPLGLFVGRGGPGPNDQTTPNSNHIRGQIDEFVMFSACLQQEDVDFLYNSGDGNFAYLLPCAEQRTEDCSHVQPNFLTGACETPALCSPVPLENCTCACINSMGEDTGLCSDPMTGTLAPTTSPTSAPTFSPTEEPPTLPNSTYLISAGGVTGEPLWNEFPACNFQVVDYTDTLVAATDITGANPVSVSVYVARCSSGGTNLAGEMYDLFGFYPLPTSVRDTTDGINNGGSPTFPGRIEFVISGLSPLTQYTVSALVSGADSNASPMTSFDVIGSTTWSQTSPLEGLVSSMPVTTTAGGVLTLRTVNPGTGTLNAGERSGVNAFAVSETAGLPQTAAPTAAPAPPLPTPPLFMPQPLCPNGDEAICTCDQSITGRPTVSPTASPIAPTTSPTASPTKLPTTSPSVSPTTSPSVSPTVSPTRNPTTSPTQNPTSSPTTSPTKRPTSSPTTSPTQNPTSSPTTSPTASPITPMPSCCVSACCMQYSESVCAEIGGAVTIVNDVVTCDQMCSCQYVMTRYLGNYMTTGFAAPLGIGGIGPLVTLPLLVRIAYRDRTTASSGIYALMNVGTPTRLYEMDGMTGVITQVGGNIAELDSRAPQDIAVCADIPDTMFVVTTDTIVQVQISTTTGTTVVGQLGQFFEDVAACDAALTSEVSGTSIVGGGLTRGASRITCDGQGNVLFNQAGCSAVMRLNVTSGTVRKIAGGVSGDSLLTEVTLPRLSIGNFNFNLPPRCLTYAPLQDAVYVVNSDNFVYRIHPYSSIETALISRYAEIAGVGQCDMDVDGQGNLIVSSSSTDAFYRVDVQTQEVTVVAGQENVPCTTYPSCGDGQTPVMARTRLPESLIVSDDQQAMFFEESGTLRATVRKFGLCVPPETNCTLAGYWPLDDLNSTLAEDLSVSQQDGAYGSSSTETQTFVKIGAAALGFDGTTMSSVSGSDTLLPEGFDACSISLWLRARSSQMSAAYFSYGMTVSGMGRSLYHTSSDSLRFGHFGSPEVSVTIPGGGYALNQWYHVTGVWDGMNTIRVYLDGSTTVGTVSAVLPWTMSGGSFYMGRQLDGTLPLDGWIDDVSVFSTELTASDVDFIYFNGFARPAASLPCEMDIDPFQDVECTAHEPDTSQGECVGTASCPNDDFERTNCICECLDEFTGDLIQACIPNTPVPTPAPTPSPPANCTWLVDLNTAQSSISPWNNPGGCNGARPEVGGPIVLLDMFGGDPITMSYTLDRCISRNSGTTGMAFSLLGQPVPDPSATLDKWNSRSGNGIGWMNFTFSGLQPSTAYRFGALIVGGVIGSQNFFVSGDPMESSYQVSALDAGNDVIESTFVTSTMTGDLFVMIQFPSQGQNVASNGPAAFAIQCEDGVVPPAPTPSPTPFESCPLGSVATCGCPRTLGACCVLQPYQCLLGSEQDCVQLGGTYQGDGSNCSSVVCPSLAPTASPTNAPTASPTPPTPKPTQSPTREPTQEPTPAPTRPPAACCMSDCCYENLNQRQCQEAGGEYQGPVTDCSAVECNCTSTAFRFAGNYAFSSPTSGLPASTIGMNGYDGHIALRVPDDTLSGAFVADTDLGFIDGQGTFTAIHTNNLLATGQNCRIFTDLQMHPSDPNILYASCRFSTSSGNFIMRYDLTGVPLNVFGSANSLPTLSVGFNPRTNDESDCTAFFNTPPNRLTVDIFPVQFVVDSQENIFYFDQGCDMILRVDSTTDLVEIVFGSSNAAAPSLSAVDSLPLDARGARVLPPGIVDLVYDEQEDTLYFSVATLHAIYKISSASTTTGTGGLVDLVAGVPGVSGNDATHLDEPGYLDIDSNGNLFVTEDTSPGSRVAFLVREQSFAVQRIVNDDSESCSFSTPELCGDGGPSIDARTTSPTDLLVTDNFHVFVAYPGNLAVIRKYGFCNASDFTRSPTVSPTASPNPPTPEPTSSPTSSPTLPTSEPTSSPTSSPSASPTSSMIVVPSCLTGYWPLERGDLTEAFDESGNGNTMDAVQGTPTSAIAHLGGGAREFGASTEHYEITPPNALGLDGGQSVWSVSVWAYMSSSTTFSGLGFIWASLGNSGSSFTIAAFNVGLSCEGINGGGGEGFASTNDNSIPRDVWTHVVCTFDGSTIRLYVDGTLEATASLTYTSAANDLSLTIGDVEVAGGNNFPWQGRVDDVAYFNKVLTLADVQFLYNSGTGRPASELATCP